MAGHRPERAHGVASPRCGLALVCKGRAEWVCSIPHSGARNLSSAPDRWGRPWRDKKSALGRYAGGRFDDVQRDVITVTHRGGC